MSYYDGQMAANTEGQMQQSNPNFQYIAPQYNLVQPPNDFINKRFNIDVEWDDLVHSWAGHRYDAVGNKWLIVPKMIVDEFGESVRNPEWIHPKMNEEGIQFVTQYCRIQSLPKILSLGNLDEVQIAEFMKHFTTELDKHLFLHEEDYGLAVEDEDAIITAVEGLVYGVISGSIQGWQAGLLQTTISNSSNVMVQKDQPQQRPGILSRMAGVFGWQGR